MKIRSYYHCYTAGTWREPATEYVAALGDAELCDTDMTIVLVGSQASRQDARCTIRAALRQQGLPDPVRWTEADEGWEQLTFFQIRADVREIPGEYAVLYAHTKGAHDCTPTNVAWRRSMTRQLVGQWQRCTELLANHDAVGCHWITQYPQNPAFFAGNFWWSKASYLRTLPEPDMTSRYQAELWLSQGAPWVHDMLPGWPGYP